MEKNVKLLLVHFSRLKPQSYPRSYTRVAQLLHAHKKQLCVKRKTCTHSIILQFQLRFLLLWNLTINFCEPLTVPVRFKSSHKMYLINIYTLHKVWFAKKRLWFSLYYFIYIDINELYIQKLNNSFLSLEETYI